MRALPIIVGTTIVVFAGSAVATTIPADALVDFRVDALAPVGDAPYTTHVAAWRNTGLLLNVGDVFSLAAVGFSRASPAGHGAPNGTPTGDIGPDGQPGNCGFCLAPNKAPYSLVGKIGESLGNEFFVGSNFSGIAEQSGLLYLGFNDSNYFDNSGFFTANTVATVPEPSTIGLCLVGMIGLAMKSRCRELRRPTSRWS